MSVRFRPELSAIPNYQAGKRPLPRLDDVTAFKVSSNENPYPPLPRVQRVIAEAAQHVNRYPDPASVELRAAIADHVALTPDQIAVATGAVALCYQCAHATAGPGDEVVFAWRSFEAYPILTSVSGAKPVPVPLLSDGTHDLPAMARAVTERTRLIFVCSPNNPTGTTVTAAEFTDFVDAVPDDVLIVLDEAYIEFSEAEDAPSAIEVVNQHANVVVLRTFSKAYGLAGLRVGYAIAAVDVIDALNSTALPFGVSSVAQSAAIASIADHQELTERVGELIARRARLTQSLQNAQVPVTASQANFVWLPLGSATAAFVVECERAGLTVRGFVDEGARVTIAEPEANERLVAVAADFVAQWSTGVAEIDRKPM